MHCDLIDNAPDSKRKRDGEREEGGGDGKREIEREERARKVGRERERREQEKWGSESSMAKILISVKKNMKRNSFS